MCMDVELARGGLVMVNFICQPDWAMQCPDIWLNIECYYGCVCEGVSG